MNNPSPNSPVTHAVVVSTPHYTALSSVAAGVGPADYVEHADEPADDNSAAPSSASTAPPQ